MAETSPKYVDIHFVARVEQGQEADDLKAALGAFKKIRIVDQVPVSPEPEKQKCVIEMTWQEELAALKEMIERIRIRYSSQTITSVDAFNALYNGIHDSLANRGRARDVKFEQDVLAIFDRSYEKYASLDQRPIRVNTSGTTRYQRISEDCVTPREIRLLTECYHLDGSDKTPQQISETESVASAINSLKDARISLLWLLTPNYRSGYGNSNRRSGRFGIR